MIPLIKSTFYKEKETKRKLVSFITGAKQLSFGKQCELFENRFGTWQGRSYCTFVNSGSSANLALIQSLLNLGRISKGDKVGFSACTWSTNVMPLIQLGLVPVPIDIELDTLNISSGTVADTLKHHKLKALFVTNLLGLCDDIDAIAKLCAKNRIFLIEDNCESLGSVYKGKKLGNWGLASTFSFYVGHHLSTIEGGAVLTDDEELATMLQIVRAHGWDRNLSLHEQERYRNTYKVNSLFYSRYTFYDTGYNLRPTEINGYLGVTQMKYADEIVRKRQKNFLDIAPALYANNNFLPLRYSHMDVISSFSFPVICTSQDLRETIVEKCYGVVEIRPVVGGNIVQQPFFKKYNSLAGTYPNAETVHTRGLYFGNNPELTKAEKNILIETFAKPVHE